jgi:hypothetical protein
MTKRLIGGVGVVAAAAVLLSSLGASAQPAPGRAAPDIAAGRWINSAPLTIEALRGRVVLVEFWTFG